MSRHGVQMLLVLVGILVMAMAGFDSDDNMSLAGLTQETHDVDVTTISSDEEPFDADENYRLLIEEARKISSNFSQVSHFDDKIFGLSHGSRSDASELEFSQQLSNAMTSSMVGNLKVFCACLVFFRCV